MEGTYEEGELSLTGVTHEPMKTFALACVLLAQVSASVNFAGPFHKFESRKIIPKTTQKQAASSNAAKSYNLPRDRSSAFKQVAPALEDKYAWPDINQSYTEDSYIENGWTGFIPEKSDLKGLDEGNSSSGEMESAISELSVGSPQSLREDCIFDLELGDENNSSSDETQDLPDEKADESDSLSDNQQPVEQVKKSNTPKEVTDSSSPPEYVFYNNSRIFKVLGPSTSPGTIFKSSPVSPVSPFDGIRSDLTLSIKQSTPTSSHSSPVPVDTKSPNSQTFTMNRHCTTAFRHYIANVESGRPNLNSN